MIRSAQSTDKSAYYSLSLAAVSALVSIITANNSLVNDFFKTQCTSRNALREGAHLQNAERSLHSGRSRNRSLSSRSAFRMEAGASNCADQHRLQRFFAPRSESGLWECQSLGKLRFAARVGVAYVRFATRERAMPASIPSRPPGDRPSIFDLRVPSAALLGKAAKDAPKAQESKA